MSRRRIAEKSGPSMQSDGVKMLVSVKRRFAALVVALLGISVMTGCENGNYEFQDNHIYRYKLKTEQDASFTPAQNDQLVTVLNGMYGTPGEPFVPAVAGTDTAAVLDQKLLTMSAGPVGRDEDGRPHGLYREHCAHCHGVTGDGRGPTAEFLNPYPRDYRPGWFKFKSTPKGFKPTHADLKKILIDGIPGTAMPSFKLLPDDEIESLVNYVKYLSMRGETERRLMNLSATLDEEDDFYNPEGDEEFAAEQWDEIQASAKNVVQSWIDADAKATGIPPRPTDWKMEESIAKGRELFYGEIANCIKCHGESALGDGQTTDFDDWTKEYYNPTIKSSLEKKSQYIARGMLKPREILPRNLRQGVFRGGRRPIDIYWRVVNGIEGTPMPGALLKDPDGPPEIKGLTPNDVWHIVDYVRSLAREPISNPGRA